MRLIVIWCGEENAFWSHRIFNTNWKRCKIFLATKKWFRVSVVRERWEWSQTAHHWQGIKFFARQQINTSANRMIFNFSILCLVSPQSRFHCTAHYSHYVWFDSGPANWRIIWGFFSVCLMVLVHFWLAVPLTQNFLGISQLDSDSSVTASMASSWPKTQFFHRSISLERTKEKHLHHLDVCVCVMK